LHDCFHYGFILVLGAQLVAVPLALQLPLLAGSQIVTHQCLPPLVGDGGVEAIDFLPELVYLQEHLLVLFVEGGHAAGVLTILQAYLHLVEILLKQLDALVVAFPLLLGKPVDHVQQGR
jgi:hypothetical protein